MTLSTQARWSSSPVSMTAAAAVYLREECAPQHIQALNPKFDGTRPGP
jgi:hypothetical protein